MSHPETQEWLRLLAITSTTPAFRKRLRGLQEEEERPPTHQEGKERGNSLTSQTEECIDTRFCREPRQEKKHLSRQRLVPRS